MQHTVTNELLILVTISVIIFTSPYFSKLFKIPIPAIEIILGAFAGLLGFVDNTLPLFKTVAEVGFFYLMFLAGTEVDLRIFIKSDKKIIRQGFMYLTLLYLLSFIFTFFLDLNTIFIIIFPIMSVGLLMTLLKEYGKKLEWLNMSMLVATMGEVVSIALLTLTGAFLDFGIGSQLYETIGYLILFLLAIIFSFKFFEVLFWWYPELKILLMPHYDKDEKDIRLSMALFFIIIAIMIFLNLEIAFGAFVAGIFIPTFFGHKTDLPHKLSSFGFGFLVPTFFIYIGSTFDIRSILYDGVIEQAFMICLVMFIIRYASAQVFIKRFKKLEVLLFALSHSMPLTLLVAVAAIAYKAEHISQNMYFAFILGSLLSAIVSMVSIKLLVVISNKKQEKSII